MDGVNRPGKDGRRMPSIKESGEILIGVSNDLVRGGDETSRGLAELQRKADAAVEARNGRQAPAEEAKAAAARQKAKATEVRATFDDLLRSASTAEEAAKVLNTACSNLQRGDADLAATFEPRIRPIAAQVTTFTDSLRQTAVKLQQAVDGLIDGADHIGSNTEQLQAGGQQVGKSATQVSSGLGQARKQLGQVIPTAAKTVGDRGREVVHAARR